ncbi:hypothetical protein MELA_01144 [Candidatus Methylomirabilis lanthanidiphila]|uniref:Right handed beta helix domain-containing protein n=1 Tax=Candidatus Methylomirabilis lanthanidiphila TaxID=2211376 RepID=A0A564ZHF5_9BACT|nr:hypothetical protein [Candidatus Methylomirabilis lanthanidiphila]VUZ84770.1 hypothetical protein MELA_01144 [Candidatus Methylomirabilis lanthanidiphila]
MLTRRSFLFGAAGVMAGCVAHTPDLQNEPRAVAPDADDTRFLQTALDKGGHVVLETGRRYTVSAQTGARAALLVKSNTFLDLAGATLELAPGQRCTMIGRVGNERITNVKIANGTIIGNGTRQPTDVLADIGAMTPTIYLTKCHNVSFHNLQLQDTYMYSIYAHGDNGVMDNISVKGAVGGGIHLDGTRWQIDHIRVRDVTYFDDVYCTGNPFIVTLKDSEIGRIYCENYGFGVKFQDGCERLTVEAIEAVAGQNNYAHPDKLVKIQGKKTPLAERHNRDIRVGRIVSRNGPSNGLYIYRSNNVEIGSYLGENNGRSHPADSKNSADVLVVAAGEIRFGEFSARGFLRYGLWLDEEAGRVVADRVEMTCGGSSVCDPIVVRNGEAVLNGVTYR